MWVFNSKDVTKIEKRPLGKRLDNVERGAKGVSPSQKTVLYVITTLLAE